jgi:hypothetical protein
LMQAKRKAAFSRCVSARPGHLAIPGPRLDSRHLTLCTHASTPPIDRVCVCMSLSVKWKRTGILAR